MNKIELSLALRKIDLKPEDIQPYAKKNCGKCFGRGYLGFNILLDERGRTLPRTIKGCKCVDYERIVKERGQKEQEHGKK